MEQKKEIIFDILMWEIGCSQAMKQIMFNTLKNWESFIWNAYEILEKNWNIEINSLYDEENYVLEKAEFEKLVDLFFEEEC